MGQYRTNYNCYWLMECGGWPYCGKLAVINV
jgi:hypothetical protein